LAATEIGLEMVGAAKGKAVAQKAHSAETLPTIHWLRPHPGQWFSSRSL
jgi:hypothetical protein